MVAFRLLWWLEEGCLDLLISRASVGTPPWLCTALHCATEMSPVLNRVCCRHPCPLWLYRPCSVHPSPVPIKAVWVGRQFLWLQVAVSPSTLQAAAPGARRIMRS